MLRWSSSAVTASNADRSVWRYDQRTDGAWVGGHERGMLGAGDTFTVHVTARQHPVSR
jgi:hypothetical protein